MSVVSKESWRPMFTAPRDGTRFIAIFQDFSGVEILSWDVGFLLDQTAEELKSAKATSGFIKSCYVQSHEAGDSHSEYAVELEDIKSFAGWNPLPAETLESDDWNTYQILEYARDRARNKDSE